MDEVFPPAQNSVSHSWIGTDELIEPGGHNDESRPKFFVDGRLVAELPAPNTQLNSREDRSRQDVAKCWAEGYGKQSVKELDGLGQRSRIRDMEKRNDDMLAASLLVFCERE
jgi:hypothetical protein